MEIYVPLLFLQYTIIVVLTILLTTILIRYLNSKALHKKYVRDYILIDLAILNGGFVVLMASTILVRLVIGPFQNEDIVATIFSLLQYMYNTMLACTVSLQLVQLLNIFHAAELSECTEDMLVTCHRLFVAVLGISSAEIVCFLKGGFCRPTPLYYYILQEHKEKEDSLQFKVQTINIVIFIVILTSCQLAIEIKKFLSNREEDRAEQIAASALRQMENATMRLNMQPPSQLEVRLLPLRVNITWQNLRGNEAPIHADTMTTANVEIPAINHNFALTNSSKKQVQNILINI